MPATSEFDNGVAGANRSGHTGLCGNVPDEGEGWIRKALAKTRAGEDKGRDETVSLHRTPWRVISAADRVGDCWRRIY